MIVKLAYPTNLDRKFGVARRRDLGSQFIYT
jgi:hypothetical protein